MVALVKTVSVDHPRPYSTYYYTGLKAADKDYSRIGRAASPKGAIAAATTRLVLGQYRHAIIHDIDGVVIYRLHRSGREIRIIGKFFEWE